MSEEEEIAGAEREEDEEEIAGAEREEDEEEIAFRSAFGVVIGWCLG